MAHPLLVLAGWVGGTVAVAKVVQAITDEEYEGRVLPTRVRERLVDEHLDDHGAWCPGWGREGHDVDEDDLTVDHIKPWSLGGRTSVNNSQILCRSCNSAKGQEYGLAEFLKGR